jgi:methionine sulfoxide reductase heme-binding subunit
VGEALETVSWTWVLIRATGITAWCVLTAVLVFGLVATARRHRGVPAPRAVLLHRRLVALALGLLAVHLGLLLVDTYEPFTVVQVLVPFTASWRTIPVALGIGAFWLCAAVWLLGRLRGARPRRWFPRAHTLAYAAWPLATAHYVLAGTDALAVWSLVILVGGTAAVVAALLDRARPVSEEALSR